MDKSNHKIIKESQTSLIYKAGNDVYKLCDENNLATQIHEIDILIQYIIPLNQRLKQLYNYQPFLNYEILDNNIIKMDNMSQNLESLLNSNFQLTETQIKQIFTQILFSIQQLHCLRIYHGDIKPSNILLEYNFQDNYFQSKLIDFQTSYHLQSDMNPNQVYRPFGFTKKYIPEYLFEYWSKNQFVIPYNPFALDLTQLNYILLEMAQKLDTPSKQLIEYIQNFQNMSFQERVSHIWIQNQFNYIKDYK